MYFEINFIEDTGFPVYYFSKYTVLDASDDSLHWHDEIELLYCLEGESEIVAGSDCFTIRKNELAVINGGTLHTLYSPKGCRYACFIVSRNFLTVLGGEDTRLASFVSDPDVSSVMDSLVREMEEQPACYQKAVMAGLTTLFIRLYRTYCLADGESAFSSDGGTGKYAVVRFTLSYIEENYRKPITIDDISGACRFSSSYVCHAFKELTGKSVMQYLVSLRCRKAEELLSSGRCGVGECAAACGFGSVAYFSKVFKKELGIQPSACRRRAKDGRRKHDI